jgi:D-sedoheptulose 7-phosphate isomerase
VTGRPLAESPAAAHLRELAALAERVAEECARDVDTLADLVVGRLRAGNKLMFCGNGGSAADAQHLATEYVVRFQQERAPHAAIALTTDTSLLTAAANDVGFEHIFARQVYALGKHGDVLFLHSTSGDSANLLRAAEAARETGVTTVALLARGGGALKDPVAHANVLPTDAGSHAQELHLAIGHAICGAVERTLAQHAQR